jgi:hypothetical protein
MNFTRIDNLLHYLTTVDKDSSEFIEFKISYEELNTSVIEKIKTIDKKNLNLFIVCVVSNLQAELLLDGLLKETTLLDYRDKARAISFVNLFEECESLHEITKQIELPIVIFIGDKNTELTLRPDSFCDFLRFKDIVKEPPTVESVYSEFSNQLNDNLSNVFKLFKQYRDKAYFLTEQERLKVQSLLVNDGFNYMLSKFDEYNSFPRYTDLMLKLQKNLDEKKYDLEKLINEKENIKKYLISQVIAQMEQTYGLTRTLDICQDFWDSLSLY